MNEGIYPVSGCLAVIDKEDKRIAALNRRKRTVNSLWIGSTQYVVGETMSLACKCEPYDMDEKKASEALPRMPTTKRSMLNDYSES